MEDEKTDSRSSLQAWWDRSDITDKVMWLMIILFVGAIALSMMGVDMSWTSSGNSEVAPGPGDCDTHGCSYVPRDGMYRLI